MADSMECKKKQRKVLRSFVTKSLNELDSLLTKSPIVLEDIEVAWECVKPKFDELCALNAELYALLLETQATEEQLLQDIEQCDGYTKRFTTFRLKIDKLLGPVEDAASVRGGSIRTSGSQVGYDDIQGKRKFKLPAIQFKQYDGNIRDWLPFWSQFRKIHADTQLDNCDKIDYLVQATVAGSRARQIVDSFPVLDENYGKIIDCLTARFGREDLQIEVYVRELLKLVLNNAVSKEKQDLSKLYDLIETQLRALDTLGITSDKYAALLFPLIESCLPQELLRIWQRSAFNSSGPGTNNSSGSGNNEPTLVPAVGDSPLEVRLRNLLSFLRAEVENEQRIDLASEGFGLADNFKTKSDTTNQSGKRNMPKLANNSTFTAAGLVNVDVVKCIFCTGVHESDKCFKAQKMTLEERKSIVLEKRACFKCLKEGHVSKRCRSRLKCIVCGYSHVPLMCLGLADRKTSPQQKESSNEQENIKKDQVMPNQTSSYIFLQTVNFKVKSQSGTKSVRALIDTGSQRSYILTSTVSSLGLQPKRVEKLVHCLFGGTEMEQVHYCYDVTISNGKYKKTLEVLDQAQICNEVPPVFYGPWIQELKVLNVEISDYKRQGPIEMLLGADVIGSLYTGKRHLLKCGLVASETYVGWTVEGKVPRQNSTTMTVTSMFTNPLITDLWQLDVLGIEDPTERKTKSERALAAKELFCETVVVNEKGRYEVRLPWLEGHPPLPTNYHVASRRLQSAVKQLEKNGLMSRYKTVFEEWERLNIIEKTTRGDGEYFLPHRPVLKEGSTTAIRPVFDASSHEKDRPSLNQCLEKGEVAIKFRKWVIDLPELLQIEIPRYSEIGGADPEEVSVHTFVDASRNAYAAVVFVRVERSDNVSIHLMAAKSRVAPIEKRKGSLTIPRLELLAATIGARLYTQVVENLTCSFNSFFWSDSSTVISWLQRTEEWGTFVHNRVMEIRRLTSVLHWRHIPGTCNPADLPSRGCSPKQLVESRWWEGPKWLYSNVQSWPSRDLIVNEEEVNKEKKKKVTTFINLKKEKVDFHLTYFSKYNMTVRMIAWLHRFVHNCRHKQDRKKGELSVLELDGAEKFIFKLIQEKEFEGLTDSKLKNLSPYFDEEGVIRLKSRVSNREDTISFRYPVVLVGRNPIVCNLIMEMHRKSCHVGVQGLLCLLREKYWILGGRKAIRSVLRRCVTCRRFDVKPFAVESPALPVDRVRDSSPFEITGVDFAGPLYLRSGEKAWVCLFTCAVYRAVHLELTTSLSTIKFLQVLRRFIARRGRPRVLYSDNGTNFRGTDNAFGNLDWDAITRETNTQRILWRFNPPSASWWGGFFERLIGVVKRLLRKVLGKASLYYEDLLTLLCDCEAVVNARPLTYVSNDQNDPVTLSPAMFLRELSDCSVVDCDLVEKTCLTSSMRHKQKLREHLKNRFRLEYLGQLKSLGETKSNAAIKTGDVVLIGNDFSQRVEWPMGKVIDVIPGKDGRIRLVRVRTSHGELLRPVQRLYLLECVEDTVERSLDDQREVSVPTSKLLRVDPDSSEKEDQEEGSASPSSVRDSFRDSARVKESAEYSDHPGDLKVSRSGRKIKCPKRYV